MGNIEIKLQESTNAKPFDENELIHKDEFDKARKWIEKRVKDAERKKKNDEHLTKEEKERIKVRLHDTITILGSRGSGKSTFIYSLLEYYRKEKNIIVIHIDPTLIEEKGHVFLTILSQIKKEVDKELLASDCNPESEAYCKNKIWRKKLKNLAAGIPSLDRIGAGFEKWQDPEFIMDKGLRSVNAAVNLESDFNEILEMGLGILDKKAYLIALDDIDIDFQKGWPVLETIRKYLTSPYIITLLSGDLKLFSKAIRKQQWKNFGKALLKNEGEELNRMSDYDDLVTEMEGQYLQKVMQPQRRIHLTTIQEKINKKGKEDEINIFIENSTDPTNQIDKFYNAILGKFGIENTYQQEAYRSFLLGLPLRTQIQFLLGLKENSSKEADVTDAFLSDLYEKRVDIDTAKANVKYLNVIILKLLLQEYTLEEAYQIQPTTTDGSLNSSFTALSFLFSQKSTENAYLIFDYFIRIGYIRNLASVLPYQKDSGSSLTPSIEGLCKHSSIYFDRVYRDILGSMTAYIRAFLNIENANTTSWGGTIPIYAPSESAKGKGELSMRIDYVFKDEPLYKRQIAFIPVSISQPNNKQSSLTTYSLYLLLGTIGEIIKQYKENADLDKTLGELSQIRSYGMPNFNYYSVLEEQGEEDKTATSSKQIEQRTLSLANSMTSWIGNYPKDYVVSPHTLGKISTRLFYALRNLEDTENENNIGDAMHNRIIILFNTLLVEEAREFIIGKALNNDNPRDSIRVFKGNIDRIDSDDFTSLRLFRWMFSCPLLISFLDKDNEDIKNIQDKINKNTTNKLLWAESIYADLKKVTILGKKKIIQNTGTNSHRFNFSIPTKLPNFSYGTESIMATVDHLKKNNISYDDFMNQKIDILIPYLKKFFSRNVKEHPIKEARKKISDPKNNIQPW
ncbi:MAG: hypothetical protein LBV72_05535 [Tannerella sp.]|jgi:energy-coupling factor transporter ATP-binding protein EcfA2|nr:hypothetical protein [Tannerella sp.]